MCDICSGGSLEQALARYQSMIDEYGWAVIAVEADGPRRPAFAYTVGLFAEHGNPELLISGCLEHTGSVGVLNELAEHISQGVRLDRGAPVPGYLASEVRVAEVAAPRRLMVAQALEGGDDVLVPALQLVRPDARGWWPGEPGWSAPGEEYFGRAVPRPRSGGPRGSRTGQRRQPARRAPRR